MVTTALPVKEPVTETVSAPKLVTGEELWAMDDIGPSELIDGRIVKMSPTGGLHGTLESRLTYFLQHHLFEAGGGTVLNGEVGIYIQRKPDRIRAADVAFISTERLPTVPAGYLDAAPELVVEIMSPSDSWVGVRQKLEDYFSIGVDEVWIVEPENRVVLVYTSPTTLEKYDDHDVVHGSGPLEGFSLLLEKLFEG